MALAVKSDLRDVWQAPTRAAAQAAMDTFDGTRVTFELQPVGSSLRLSLTHEPLAANEWARPRRLSYTWRGREEGWRLRPALAADHDDHDHDCGGPIAA
jgi:hypothetical protein